MLPPVTKEEIINQLNEYSTKEKETTQDQQHESKPVSRKQPPYLFALLAFLSGLISFSLSPNKGNGNESSQSRQTDNTRNTDLGNILSPKTNELFNYSAVSPHEENSLQKKHPTLKQEITFTTTRNQKSQQQEKSASQIGFALLSGFSGFIFFTLSLQQNWNKKMSRQSLLHQKHLPQRRTHTQSNHERTE